MLWNGEKMILRLLCLVMTCSLPGFCGCRRSPADLEGEPVSDVLLRYRPEVGQTLQYRVSMNLEKNFFARGRWLREGNERGEVTLSLVTVEQGSAGYRTEFDGGWGRSNFSEETRDVMEDKLEAARTIDLTISDRYVWDQGGTQNLCFPDSPVSAGAEWEGTVLFQFGDLATVDPPTLRMAYRLIKAVRNDRGRFCVIECVPMTDHLEVPLQLGQLGLKCDATGTVTAVRQDSDAQGKIRVGDVLTAVNGHKAADAKAWHVLYERFIEMPGDVGSDVRLTIRRDGREREVVVRKGSATVGTMEVTLRDATRTVVFDVDRGVVVSDEASPVYSVMYRFLDAFGFLDDYMGSSSFEGCAGTEVGPRVYHNQFEMTLL